MQITQDNWIDKMNNFSVQGIPFIFIIDFEIQTPIVIPLEAIDSSLVLFNFNGRGNLSTEPRKRARTNSNFTPRIRQTISNNSTLDSRFVTRDSYHQKFQLLQNEQRLGNSYLANLTFSTEIDRRIFRPKYTLWNTVPQFFRRQYMRSFVRELNAPYKLWLQADYFTSSKNKVNEILVFSPERFVQTHNQKIYTYPMKGTAEAISHKDIPMVTEMLLANEKEEAEHITVVDLLRNDLAAIGNSVTLDSFRSVSTIQLTHSYLVQISSCITAQLPQNWQENLGTIMAKLLPAGSVTGAPKKETFRIIQDLEQDPRGYYCGVAGIFDGQNIDSCVLIRFIERRGGQFFFRSGGGITIYSKEEQEYAELQAKIGIPLRKNSFPEVS